MGNKNLEAENELFKGLIRTPLAFLVGGPTGLIGNFIFTALKADKEIDRENKHKEYVKAQYKKIKTPDEYRLDENQKKKAKGLLYNNQINFLKNEFRDSEDISFAEWSGAKYLTKEVFTYVNRRYRVSIRCGSNFMMDSIGATYLPEDEFIAKYKEDMANNNIIKKYKLYNNDVRVTFCYTTLYDNYCTGMFTQI